MHVGGLNGYSTGNDNSNSKVPFSYTDPLGPFIYDTHSNTLSSVWIEKFKKKYFQSFFTFGFVSISGMGLSISSASSMRNLFVAFSSCFRVVEFNFRDILNQTESNRIIDWSKKHRNELFIFVTSKISLFCVWMIQRL